MDIEDLPERGRLNVVIPDKKAVILNLLDEIATKKKAYQKKMSNLKRKSDMCDAFVSGMGAIAVSSLIVTLTTLNPITLILGASCSTASTVGGAVLKAIDYRGKFESCKTTYTNLADLERETRAVLVRNHLESRDYQNLIEDMNHRLSLIYDTANPIKIN
jgi:hypothetical protein